MAEAEGPQSSCLNLKAIHEYNLKNKQSAILKQKQETFLR
jgi:hypothetical protein